MQQTFPDFISLSKNTDIFRELLQTMQQTFPDFIWLSNNTNIFRELVANNITQFFRVYIKQYCYFQRANFKLNYSKNFFQISYHFFQSSYHSILTLSESYKKTTLAYSEIISNSIHTFTELLPNNRKHFSRVWIVTWRDRKFSNGKFPSKSEKS